jgi:hypothetical protein
MRGWLRHLALLAQARTGFSPQIVVWALISAISSAAMLIFLCVTAFVWLAGRYDALTASLVLTGLFLVASIVAGVACVLFRRANIEHAQRELAARSPAIWLDPKLVALGFKTSRALGWRGAASLAAVAVLAVAVGQRFGHRPSG